MFFTIWLVRLYFIDYYKVLGVRLEEIFGKWLSLNSNALNDSRLVFYHIFALTIMEFDLEVRRCG